MVKLSKKLINSRLQILSNKMNEFVKSESNKYVSRNKKTTLADALAFKMLYSQKHMTQDDVTNKINKFINSFIQRSCYAERSKLIDDAFLFSYLEKMNDEIDSLFPERRNETVCSICAVDGSKARAYSSAQNQSFKTNKSG